MWMTIATAAGKIAEKWFERRGRINEAKERATLEAIANRQRNIGWMDDFLLVMHAAPIIGVFISYTRESTIEGIQALSLLPEWYLAVWFTIVASVWGAPKLASLKVRRAKKGND